jgi:hypothetical protein
MPLFRGSVWKRLTADASGRGWRNIYVINAADPVAALTTVDEIALLEQKVIGSNITIFEETAEEVGVKNHYAKVSVNYAGEVVVGLAPLPLFNTLRVDVYATGKARPERKYLRLGLGADYIVGANWTAAVVSDTATNYATPLAAIPEYVAPDGTAHFEAIVLDPIQMRQVHWHRRFRKGFHRAYVPNA